MGHWFEVWARPGDPNFGRRLLDPVSRIGTLHDGVNLLGDGTMSMPTGFPDFDGILKIDPITPANSVSSLVRVFSEADPTTPVFEWLPNQIVPPQSKDDPDVNVSGWSIKSVLDYGRVEPFDWDGSDAFEPNQPDWEWGGANLLTNADFEDNQVTPQIYELVISASAGSYTLSDGTDTTSAIAFNADAGTIATRLQTDIGAITDVDVGNAGPGTFIIQFIVPPFGVNLTINTGGLTGTGTITETQAGELSPSPWTRSMSLAQGVPKDIGNYDQFGVSDEQNHTPGGTYSLKIDPGPVGATSNRNAGAQQVVRVNGGAVHQASIWIRPTSGTDTYRFGLYTVGGEIIVLTTSASFTANVWTQITISDILIPEGVNQVIFRILCSNAFPTNPAAFYIDDAELIEGLAATTIGEIVRLLYEQMIDDTLQGTIYWDDGQGTDTPYLTLDFTDAVDSAGVAWDRDDLTLRVYQRQTLLQVLELAGETWDYEFRVVPDDVETGTWLLQLYNPNGMQTDYTTAAGPAIQGGQADTSRGIRRFLPATDYMVEGTGRVTARARHAALLGALGKIGAQRIARNLPSLDAVAEAASEDAADAVAAGLTYPYVITVPASGVTGADTPLDDYVLGDALTIHDPPDVDDAGRLWDVTATFSPDQTEWEVQFLPLAVFT